MRTLYPLGALFAGTLLLTACGDDDDDGGTTAADDCGIVLLDVEELDEDDFRLRVRNDSGRDIGQLSVEVFYLDDGVQLSEQGIGVVSNVGDGATVEIETVGGFSLDGRDYDCARFDALSLQQGAGSGCEVSDLGDRCD